MSIPIIFWTWTGCWNQKPFPAGKIRNTAAIRRGTGTGVFPLIFVHGWQGDIGYRSAAWLTDWAHSPVLNLYGFISFYMGNPTLNEKYHIYLMHWPGYKHIDFSGNLFSQMLHNVQTHHSETDLGIGMNDPTTGVVVLTHSTGGLITP